MRVLRILLCVVCVLIATIASASSPRIVSYNGKKCYLHKVEQGQTLYSLSKRYGVTIKQIEELNPSLRSEGLRTDATIFIPYVEGALERADASVSQGGETSNKAAAQPQSEDGAFRVHTAQRGETLYSIANAYKISLSVLEADNPGAKDGLSIGEKVRVRRSQIGYARTSQIEREAQERGGSSTQQTPVGEGYHKVKPGETVYSLSRAYRISEEDFLRLNNMSSASQLKAGMVVRIKPSTTASQHTSAAASSQVSRGDGATQGSQTSMATTESVNRPSTQVETPASTQRDRRRGEARKRDSVKSNRGIFNNIAIDSAALRRSEDFFFGEDNYDGVSPFGVDFWALGRRHTLKTALLLPFHRDTVVNPNYVDFYRGVLLAMEDLKNEGLSVELSVFDTESSSRRVSDIVGYERGLLEANLIIGPVHNTELRYVLDFAEKNSIPVVSPLADVEGIASDALFQMQAEGEYEFDKARHLFQGHREVVVIYASSSDYGFLEQISPLLRGASMRQNINFKFDKGSFFYRRDNYGNSLEEIDIMDLMRTPTPKTFVVVADKETDIDRILVTLSSVRANITARGMLMGEYRVLGNRKWMDLNINPKTYFDNDVVFPIRYHAKRSNDVVRKFDGRYVETFGALPSMFSYRGYDAAIIFCKRMFGITNPRSRESESLEAICGERITPLATTYCFKYENGMYINTEWSLEHYTHDMEIEVY